jgi:putative ABC transport system permease protein
MNDLRYAFRQLLRNPGFTAVAVLTLGLGIGANTAVFSVAKAVLFRPLGFESPERLMWFRLANTQTGTFEDRLSWQEIEDIRGATRSFQSIATFGSPGAVWESDGQQEEISALRMTPNLGDVLRVRPVLGRMFLPSDTADAAQPVVLISHELWQARFGGSANVIGKVLRLDQRSHTIVGVLPAGLQFPLERAPSIGTGSALNAGVKNCWLPMSEPRGLDRTSRDARMFLFVGRLKANVTEATARAELAALGKRIATDHPETNRHWSFDLLSLRDQVLGRTRQGIPLLGVAVAAVLLICCVNLANLLLARGVARQRELAVRLALGAGRRRLVRTLMLESTLLALLGGGLGIALANAALKAIRVLGSAHVPFVREATLDGAAVVFTAGLSLLTAFAFGLLPALRQSRIEGAETLRTGARTTGGPQIRAWQQGLLVGQIAMVLVLLASAGLLLESFRRLMAQDLGYKPQSVIALDLSTPSFDTNGDVCRMYRALRERLAALPGVEAVGTISSAPLTGKWTFNEKPQVVGQPVPEEERPSLAATFVAFDYFQAMGIPLLDGRSFRDAELKDDGYGQIVILNEAAAAALFPGKSAVGGRFTVGSNPDRVLEVVGVVKDTRDVRLEEKPQPRFYWQYAFGGAQVVVRSSASANALMPMLRDAVRQTDARVRLNMLTPMAEIVSSTVAERRFLTVMLATYAAVALGIAAMGIFGVIAYQVAQRTIEFGVRLALGASPGGLLRLVLVQAGRMAAAGLAVGLALSFATNRLLASQLFGVSPHDPILLATVSVVLMLVALAACWLPARRAARVDPMEALRYE